MALQSNGSLKLEKRKLSELRNNLQGFQNFVDKKHIFNYQ